MSGQFREDIWEGGGQTFEADAILETDRRNRIVDKCDKRSGWLMKRLVNHDNDFGFYSQ